MKAPLQLCIKQVLSKARYGFIVSLVLLLAACATPPNNKKDICSIFYQKQSWYADAVAMEKKWGTPMQVAMAFIFQESSYVHDARPPYKFVLGFIPWGRVSSAYGYAQALDQAWLQYERSTGDGGSRTDFGDAIMFVGWYVAETHKRLGVSKWDAYRQYLAYHEGRGGYSRKSYAQKPYLKKIARKVQGYAKNYSWQLKKCRPALEKRRKRHWSIF